MHVLGFLEVIVISPQNILSEKHQAAETSLANIGFLGCWTADRVQRRLRLSEKYSAILDLEDAASCQGCACATVEERLHPADMAWFRSAIGPGAVTDRHRILEFRVIDRTGDVRWVQRHLKFLKVDRDGRAMEERGILFDVTNLKLRHDSDTHVPVDEAVFGLVDNLMQANVAAESLGLSDTQERLAAMLLEATPNAESRH